MAMTQVSIATAVAQAPDTAMAAPATVGASLLPADLSPWSMFLNADLVVQAVMVGLAIASVVTWTICLAKGLELLQARRGLRQDLAAVAVASGLAGAAETLAAGRRPGRALLEAAEAEWRQSADALHDADGVKERVASQLERIEATVLRRMTKGTGVLATIGATAPFVGLFGTVWGIMNSFIGISQSHTTNLAVVAPGIAQALLATACGLVAAIPAVVIYNHFARVIAVDRAVLRDITASVLCLVSRDLSRAGRLVAPLSRATD